MTLALSGIFAPQMLRPRMSSDSWADRSATHRAVMRWILAAFFSAAGIAHLWAPDKLLAITPSWVPFAPQLIFVTGLCELAGSIALVTKPLRWWAGIALAVYAICAGPPISSTRSTPSSCLTLPIAGSIMAPGWRFSR
jgi:uncharacterized membrane protein